MQEYPGQRNTVRYHYDGFDYRQDNLNLLRTVNYRCSKTRCNGRARHDIESPNIITVTQCHNHARNTAPFRTHQLRAELGRRAATDLHTKISKIFLDTCRLFPDAAEHVWPERERKKMRDIRRKLLPRKIPDTYIELANCLETDEKLEKYVTVEGREEGAPREKFFQKTLTDTNGKVSLVFTTDHMLSDCLMKATKIKLDATFKSLSRKPKGRQLFTIHAWHGIHAFKVVSVLMEAKSTAAYCEIFRYLKEKLPGWSPTEIVTDFEKSLRKAVKKEFPEASVTGCYFHYTQAVQGNWSKLGLMKLEPRFQKEASDIRGSLLALPFAKEIDIAPIFEQIDMEMTLALRLRLNNCMDYFKKTWLSENDKNFKPKDYCVYGKPDRTNNHVEAFHSTLHDVHPNIWHLLEILGGKLVEARQNYGRMNNGIDITANIPLKVLYNDQRIVQGRELYEAGRIGPLQFVRWCRNSVKATLAVVRQGRRLRRLLKAEEYQVEFDDVETTSGSDSSVDSEHDFDYNPNPYVEGLVQQEDEAAQDEWEAGAQFNDSGDDFSDAASNATAETDIPSDDNGIWTLEEDAELSYIQQADEAFPMHIPQVATPNNIVPAPRGGQTCVICTDNQATVVVLPCRHTFLCSDCSHLFTSTTCSMCYEQFVDRLDIITT